MECSKPQQTLGLRVIPKKGLDAYPQPLPLKGGEWLRKVQAKETTAQVAKI